ncbi:MAG: phosphoribosyltransferase [Opitutales bacterium]
MANSYRNRWEAGERLLAPLEPFLDNAILLALPRGGVKVAEPIARRTGVPLDVMMVRKLGVPGQEELAMGAIAEGGFRVVNERVTEQLRDPESALDEAGRREREELRRRADLYRVGRDRPNLAGRAAILIDDGLATGATMKAAAHAVREEGAAKVVVAVPVAPPETIRELEQLADVVVCPMQPKSFLGVGAFYDDFTQVTDEEVRETLSGVAA